MSSSESEKNIYLKNSNTEYHATNEAEFYKNGNRLINEEADIDFTENQFRLEIKYEIKKLLSHKYDNIIFLSGAGTSIGPPDLRDWYGKTMNEFWQPISNKLEETEDIFTLDELSELINYNLKYEDNNNINDNFEDFISQAKRFIPFVCEEYKTKLDNTIKKMYKVIVRETTYSYCNEYLEHISVLRVLTDMTSQPNKLTVVTTNYDLLFEEAAEEMNYTVIDGFTFTTKPKFNPDLFNWNLVRQVENVSTKEVEYKENVINLLKIHGSNSWFKDEDGNIYRDLPQNNLDEIPVMIFPSTEKYAESYETPYFDLFTIFQKFLMKNNTLLITSGFSFGDMHISSIIENAIKNNNGLNLLITDHSLDGEKSAGWDIMRELSSNHYPVTFVKSDFSEIPYYLGE